MLSYRFTLLQAYDCGKATWARLRVKDWPSIALQMMMMMMLKEINPFFHDILKILVPAVMRFGFSNIVILVLVGDAVVLHGLMTSGDQRDSKDFEMVRI